MDGRTRPRVVLLGCFLMTTGYGAFMLGPSSIFPLLERSFNVGTAEAGLAISAGFFGWLIFQIPSGLLLDRYDNRPLVRLAVVAFVGAMVAGLFVQSFASFLFVRVAGGMTGGIIFTGNANIVSQVFPANRRGFATGLFVGAGPTGMALGQASSPLLANAADWPTAFLVFSMLAVVGYAIFHWSLRRPIRNDDDLTMAGFVRALTDRPVVLVGVAAMVTNGLFIFLNSWMPTYAANVIGLPLSLAGGLAALSPIAGILGRPAGGWLSDTLGKRRLVLLGALTLAVPVLIAVPLTSSAVGFGVLLFSAGLLLQLTVGVSLVFGQELGAAEAAGTSLAVISVANILGGLGTPIVGGWLVEASSWSMTFVAMALLGVVGIVALLLTPRAQHGAGLPFRN